MSLTVMPKLASVSGRTQKRIAYLAGAEDCYLADTRHAAHRIVDVDIRVIGEETLPSYVPLGE